MQIYSGYELTLSGLVVNVFVFFADSSIIIQYLLYKYDDGDGNIYILNLCKKARNLQTETNI